MYLKIFILFLFYQIVFLELNSHAFEYSMDLENKKYKPVFIYLAEDSPEPFMKITVDHEVYSIKKSCLNIKNFQAAIVVSSEWSLSLRNSKWPQITYCLNGQIHQKEVHWPILTKTTEITMHPLANNEVLKQVLNYVTSNELSFSDPLYFLQFKSHGVQDVIAVGGDYNSFKPRIDLQIKYLRKQGIKWPMDYFRIGEGLTEKIYQKIADDALTAGFYDSDKMLGYAGNLKSTPNEIKSSQSKIYESEFIANIKDLIAKNKKFGFIFVESCNKGKHDDYSIHDRVDPETFHGFVMDKSSDFFNDMIFYFRSEGSLSYHNIDWRDYLEKDDDKEIWLLDYLEKLQFDIPKILEIYPDEDAIIEQLYIKSDNDEDKVMHSLLNEIEYGSDPEIKRTYIRYLGQFKNYEPYKNIIEQTLEKTLFEKDFGVRFESLNTLNHIFTKNISIIRKIAQLLITEKDERFYKPVIEFMHSLHENTDDLEHKDLNLQIATDPVLRELIIRSYLKSREPFSKLSKNKSKIAEMLGFLTPTIDKTLQEFVVEDFLNESIEPLRENSKLYAGRPIDRIESLIAYENEYYMSLLDIMRGTPLMIDKLVKGLVHGREFIRNQTFSLIKTGISNGTINPTVEPLFSNLVQFLDNPDIKIRKKFLRLLTSGKFTSKSYIEKLSSILLTNPHVELRRIAARELSELASTDHSLLPIFEKSLKNEKLLLVRIQILNGLSILKPQEAIDIAFTYINIINTERDPRLRNDALLRLLKLKVKHPLINDFLFKKFVDLPSNIQYHYLQYSTYDSDELYDDFSSDLDDYEFDDYEFDVIKSDSVSMADIFDYFIQDDLDISYKLKFARLLFKVKDSNRAESIMDYLIKTSGTLNQDTLITIVQALDNNKWIRVKESIYRFLLQQKLNEPAIILELTNIFKNSKDRYSIKYAYWLLRKNGLEIPKFCRISMMCPI